MQVMEIAPQLATMVGVLFVFAVALIFIGAWLDREINDRRKK